MLSFRLIKAAHTESSARKACH